MIEYDGRLIVWDNSLDYGKGNWYMVNGTEMEIHWDSLEEDRQNEAQKAARVRNNQELAKAGYSPPKYETDMERAVREAVGMLKWGS